MIEVMNKSERDSLSDNQMLFTLLTALVKKSGGEIMLTEHDMDSVLPSDSVMMYYDKGKKIVVLTLGTSTSE